MGGLKPLSLRGRHDLDEYTVDMDWSMRREPTLREPLALLRAANVEQARPIPTKLPGSQIHLSPSGGWTSDGPDGAVEELDDFLAAKLTDDVRRKLGESGAAERHAWVWTDGDTPGRVRRPLEEDWGLPSRAAVAAPGDHRRVAGS